MKRLFYPRLALSNIKKNAKTYIPYILTCIFTISLFYMMHSISINEGLKDTFGGSTIMIILSYGVAIVGIFSIIFLFYTNSFLIKRRKKEIGLYNILGMEKRHIMVMLSCEIFFVAIISLVSGLVTGILLSKLMFLLLLNIVHMQTALSFSINQPSIMLTILLFSGIFLATLIFNLFQIHISNPIALLKGESSGEKEPKSKLIITLLGIACLTSGYYIAQTIDDPMLALFTFFGAVILVMIATYCLFISGSIVILKVLKRKKSFYYKTNHFTAISGMIYRMKQNAVGLANICILSTCIIVMLSTTISLYIGQEDILDTRFNRNVIVKLLHLEEETDANDVNERSQKIQSIYQEEAKKYGITTKDILNYVRTGFISTREGNTFQIRDRYGVTSSELNLVQFLTVDDYNRIENKQVKLNPGEVLYFKLHDDSKAPKTININNQELKVVEQLDSIDVLYETTSIVNNYCFVVNNQDTLNTISKVENDSISIEYIYAFNMETNTDNDIEFIQSFQEKIEHNISGVVVESKELARQDFFALYGGFFFIGVFLGMQFLMATVLIIYYKQISEGYEDKERYQIMQKVGMSRKEVKRSINTQVLMVFFLPLIVAIIHFGFAFKMMTKLLSVLNLTNVPLFIICSAITISLFALIYAFVYYITSKVYYKIVK